MRLNQPMVGMAATPTGNGYWLVASDGGIFAFGDARFYGSTGAITSTSPSSAWPPSRAATATGWWRPTAAIFAFGDAGFPGSTGGIGLASPIAGITSAHAVATGSSAKTAAGSRSVARRSTVAANAAPPQPVVDLAATPTDGYWLTTSFEQAVHTAGENGVFVVDPNLVSRTRESTIASELMDRLNAASHTGAGTRAVGVELGACRCGSGVGP